jgi:hypothetical protein
MEKYQLLGLSNAKAGGKGKMARMTNAMRIPIINMNTKRHLLRNIVSNLHF